VTRILFVDDEAWILNGLRRLLRRASDPSWELEFFTDARAALARMSEVPCDIVVSDLRMPLMDGVAFLAQVHERHPSTLRIILSGHADREMILQVTEHAHQFLTKPCDGSALIGVLQSADRRHATLPGARSSAGLKGIERVPSLPVTYSRIMSAIQVHEPDMNELGKIVEQDVGVSARILQIANSSFFGLRNQVARPAEAVRVLGIDTVRGLALTVGLFQELHADAHVLGVLGRITDHCITIGSLARRFALVAGLPRATADLAMQAGLMHDVGEFVIAELFPAAFLESHQAGDSSTAHGRVVRIGQLDVTQAEVGAYLLGIWGLPDAVVEAVALNGEPARIRGPELSVAAIVYVARVLERVPASVTLSEVRAKLGPEFVSRLGLDKLLGAWTAAIAEGS